jgi:hypothetical protein
MQTRLHAAKAWVGCLNGGDILGLAEDGKDASTEPWRVRALWRNHAVLCSSEQATGHDLQCLTSLKEQVVCLCNYFDLLA